VEITREKGRANASYSKKYFPESENGLFAFKTVCFRSFGQEVEQLLLYDASALRGKGGRFRA
jgi:hypothetical protein